MKKLFFAIALLAGAGFATSALAGPSVTVKIEIGKKKDNCRKIGLCKISIVDIGRAAGVRGTMTLSPDETSIRWTFSAQDLQQNAPDKVQYFDGQSSVVFEESYAFTDEENDALGASRALTVPAGTYPVSYSNGMYTVVLSVR